MANKTLKTRVMSRRDTAANWKKANPVLLRGEIILVDTTSGEVRLKIGDGAKTFSQLPYQDEILRNSIPKSMEELGIYVQAGAPSNPKQDDLWVDTANKVTQFFDGSNWIIVGTASSGGSYTKVDQKTVNFLEGAGSASFSLKYNENMQLVILSCSDPSKGVSISSAGLDAENGLKVNFSSTYTELFRCDILLLAIIEK